MQIVIDIPEKTYEQLRYLNKLGFGTVIDNAVANGTPLPKGHGRLIDINQLDDCIVELNANGSEITRGEYKTIEYVLSEMQTVVEADKEDAE